MNEGKVSGENVSRMGMLHFKNDKLPDTKALLRIHDGHIDITIVWNPSDSTFERCFFSEHVFYADDPDRKKYVYDLPKQIWFRDSQGSVDLLSCKVRSCKEKYGAGANGIIDAEYAVLDASVGEDYSRVNAVRTSLDGLREWLGISSVLVSAPIVDDNNRVKEREYTLKCPADSIGSGIPAFNFVPYWTVSVSGDTTELHDLAYMESASHEVRRWQEHLENHRAMRDLLRISSWSEHVLSIGAVCRKDDPLRVESGIPYQERWCKVIKSHSNVHSYGGRINYLIKYSDFRDRDLSSWFKLRDVYARGIDPIVSLFSMREASIEAWVMQLGVGFEALGYQLLQEKGYCKKEAGKTAFADRLCSIISELGDAWPFDLVLWKDEMTRSYNSIKHANRTPVDRLQSLNAWREGILVFRGWVALRLGIPKDRLLQRLQFDPLIHPYVRVEQI